MLGGAAVADAGAGSADHTQDEHERAADRNDARRESEAAEDEIAAGDFAAVEVVGLVTVENNNRLPDPIQ